MFVYNFNHNFNNTNASNFSFYNFTYGKKTLALSLESMP